MKIISSGTVFDATVAPPDQRSNAFTSLVQLSSGAFLAAFRTASSRDDPGGRLKIMRSVDGVSWAEQHPGLTATIHGIRGDLYAGYFTEMSPGRLLGGFLWVDRSDPDRSFVNPETAGILPTRNLLAESADEGATWSGFREIDLTPETGGSITGPIFALGDGSLALPYETWKAWDDRSLGVHTASLRLSTDGGLTWPEREIVASDPAGDRFFWDQRIARHPASGRQVAMFWTHDRSRGIDLENHIAWSEPAGRAWTNPVPAGWQGQHCQPIALGDDLLAAVFVRRRDPASIRLRISDDFGQTWLDHNELILYHSESHAGSRSGAPVPFEEFWQDMMRWEFGHPRGVLTRDGDLLVVWYGGGRAATSVHYCWVDPEEFAT